VPLLAAIVCENDAPTVAGKIEVVTMVNAAGVSGALGGMGRGAGDCDELEKPLQLACTNTSSRAKSLTPNRDMAETPPLPKFRKIARRPEGNERSSEKQTKIMAKTEPRWTKRNLCLPAIGRKRRSQSQRRRGTLGAHCAAGADSVDRGAINNTLVILGRFMENGALLEYRILSGIPIDYIYRARRFIE